MKAYRSSLTSYLSEEVEMLVLDWIETWYNLRRKHTFNGYRSPAEREMKRAA